MPTVDLAYHYCSTASFHKIVSSGVLWATTAAYLSDPRDCLWLLDHAREETTRYSEFIQELPPNVARYARTMVGSLLTSEFPMLESWSQNHLVACFSRDPSTLSQWRHYADDCFGVALGVDIDVLAKEVWDEQTEAMGRTFGWKQVHYGDPGVTQLFEQICDAWRAAAQHSDDMQYVVEHKSGFIDFIEERLSNLVRARYAYTKHPAYAEEAEVRLIIPEVAKIWPESFNLVRNRIVPCCEIPLAPNGRNNRPAEYALKSVVLGPRCPTRRSDVQSLLKQAGFQDVDVVEPDFKI